MRHRPPPKTSPLIGGTHNASATFWEEGGIAKAGIESMAETGGTSTLTGEINAEISNGNARDVMTGSGTSSPTTTNPPTIQFEMHRDFPLVTLVTMIAPSPDWFVGVAGLSLIENGEWVQQIVVDLFAYDSGTDSGLTYTHPTNEDTNPQDPISALTDTPFNINGEIRRLGTFTFTKQ